MIEYNETITAVLIDLFVRTYVQYIIWHKQTILKMTFLNDRLYWPILLSRDQLNVLGTLKLKQFYLFHFSHFIWEKSAAFQLFHMLHRYIILNYCPYSWRSYCPYWVGLSVSVIFAEMQITLQTNALIENNVSTQNVK